MFVFATPTELKFTCVAHEGEQGIIDTGAEASITSEEVNVMSTIIEHLLDLLALYTAQRANLFLTVFVDTLSCGVEPDVGALDSSSDLLAWCQQINDNKIRFVLEAIQIYRT